MAIPAATPSLAPVRKQEHGRCSARPSAGTLILRYTESTPGGWRGRMRVSNAGVTATPATRRADRVRPPSPLDRSGLDHRHDQHDGAFADGCN
jgi:hypothetical protein